jgi:hypothetical protein
MRRPSFTKLAAEAERYPQTATEEIAAPESPGLALGFFFCSHAVEGACSRPERIARIIAAANLAFMFSSASLDHG